jgi:hypothetical protein
MLPLNGRKEGLTWRSICLLKKKRGDNPLLKEKSSCCSLKTTGRISQNYQAYEVSRIVIIVLLFSSALSHAIIHVLFACFTTSEDFLVHVKAQVMVRDDSKGGWVPRGAGGMSIVGLCQLPVASSTGTGRDVIGTGAPLEFLIYGRRIADRSVRVIIIAWEIHTWFSPMDLTYSNSLVTEPQSCLLESMFPCSHGQKIVHLALHNVWAHDNDSSLVRTSWASM